MVGYILRYNSSHGMCVYIVCDEKNVTGPTKLSIPPLFCAFLKTVCLSIFLRSLSIFFCAARKKLASQKMDPIYNSAGAVLCHFSVCTFYREREKPPSQASIITSN